MKKLLLLFTLMMSCLTSAFCAPIGQDQARLKASRFLKEKGKTIVSTPARAPKARTEKAVEPAYYVFNAQQGKGFVIISGDDATEEVLGYVDQGTFDEAVLPTNLVDWLSFVNMQIELVRSGKAKAAAWRTIAAHADVPQRMTTKWNQGTPFNNSCPMDGGERSVTGCVATAIAQVMNYHRWPQGPTGTLDAYTTQSKNISVSALPSTTFDWDHMLGDYSQGYTNEEANAVATLMRYCGQGSFMDYTNGSSNASYWNSVNALKNCFGYDQDMCHIFADNYEMEEWESMVYNELTTNGPVAYAGNSGSSGHAFVIDGYRGSDKMYYANWGWGGYCDGWYKLFIMNPSYLGIGGGNSTEGYRLRQEMIRGFKPEKGIDESASLVVKPCLYGRDAVMEMTEQNGLRAVTFYMKNASEVELTYDIALIRIKDDKSFDILSSGSGKFVSGGYYWYWWTLDDWLGNYYAGQTFKLSFASKLTTSDEWLPFYDLDTYIEASVSAGGNVTYTVHKSAEPDVDLKAYNFSFTGNGKQFEMQSLTFTVGQCSTDYRGKVYLITDNGGNGHVICGETYVALLAGDEEIVKADFTLGKAGNHTLKVTTDEAGNNVIGICSVTIEEGASENAFYLIGDINKWSTTDKSYPFALSTDKLSWSVVFPGPTMNDQYLKVAPASAYEHQDSFWSRLWCVATDGSTALTGYLVVGDKGAIKIVATNEQVNYRMRIVPSEMTYEITVDEPNSIEMLDVDNGQNGVVVYTLGGSKMGETKKSDLNVTLKQLPKGLYLVKDENKCIIIRN